MRAVFFYADGTVRRGEIDSGATVVMVCGSDGHHRMFEATHELDIDGSDIFRELAEPREDT